MKALTVPTFERTAKKLNKNEKKHLDDAVRKLLEQPNLGEEKKGDLSGIFVYKYRIKSQLWLLAYSIDSEQYLTLRLIGPHQNFYEALKRNVSN